LSLDLRESTDAVNAAVNAKLSLLNGGFIRIYAGERPASANDATQAKMLAELRWATPAFNAAADGEAKSREIAQAEAVDTGTASWFRALSAAAKPIFDGSVGQKGGEFNLTLATTSISKGVIVKLDRFVYRQPKQA
jgi:hypothetical protein